VTAPELDLSELGDGALAIGIARERHDALAEVYERHGATVHELALRLCGNDFAGEVVRAVFLDLWNAPEQFDSGVQTMRSFLLTTTHARAVRHLRASSAPLNRQGADDKALTLLERLPAQEADAIRLTYFYGYTVGRAAEALALNEKVVADRIRAGLRRLRVLVSPPAGAADLPV
jgi:RNA polymerase sigma-70 factor (ECF subfamily)